MVKALVVTIFGGLGSFKGTIWAAYIIGLLEAFLQVYMGASWALPGLFFFMIVMLIIRPSGLFGLGEKFTRLDKVGQRVVSWTLDALGAASERSYKNVPFLMSSAGYGLFVNTGRRCVFELGTNRVRRTASLWTARPNLWLQPANPPIFSGNIQLAGWLRSRPNGLFDCGCPAAASTAMTRHPPARRRPRAERSPCDVIHIDPWWMRWRKYADFEWDRGLFPIRRA
jgi:alpha-D-xyloside xylohydrolase